VSYWVTHSCLYQSLNFRTLNVDSTLYLLNRMQFLLQAGIVKTPPRWVAVVEAFPPLPPPSITRTRTKEIVYQEEDKHRVSNLIVIVCSFWHACSRLCTFDYLNWSLSLLLLITNASVSIWFICGWKLNNNNRGLICILFSVRYKFTLLLNTLIVQSDLGPIAGYCIFLQVYLLWDFNITF